METKTLTIYETPTKGCNYICIYEPSNSLFNKDNLIAECHLNNRQTITLLEFCEDKEYELTISPVGTDEENHNLDHIFYQCLKTSTEKYEWGHNPTLSKKGYKEYLKLIEQYEIKYLHREKLPF